MSIERGRMWCDKTLEMNEEQCKTHINASSKTIIVVFCSLFLHAVSDGDRRDAIALRAICALSHLVIIYAAIAA